MSRVTHERALEILVRMPKPCRHREACERLRIAYAIRWHRAAMREAQ